jgi:hypothetical protein
VFLEKPPALFDDLLFDPIAVKQGWGRMLYSEVAVLELPAAAAKAWVVAADLGAAAAERGTSHAENVPVVVSTMSGHPLFYHLPLQKDHPAFVRSRLAERLQWVESRHSHFPQ